MSRDGLLGLREQIKENIRLIIGPNRHGEHFKSSSFLITTSFDEESYTAVAHTYAGGVDRSVMTGYPSATAIDALENLLEISSRVVSLMKDVRRSLPPDNSEWWERNSAAKKTAFPPGSWIDIALRFAAANVASAMVSRLDARMTRPVQDYGLAHQGVRGSAGSLGGNPVWWNSPEGTTR